MTQIQVLQSITQYLVGVNAAIPVVFATINAVALLFKGITGSGPTLAELADLIESQIDQNDAALKADLARYRATLGQ